MKVFCHHLYEYKKGVRRMILHTMPAIRREWAVKKLQANGIAYYIDEVSAEKFNVFFGDEDCVKVVASFMNKPLHESSNEEDFIIGVLLGYDPVQQCRRYLKRRAIKEAA